MSSKATNRVVGKRIADRYCITGEIGKGGMGAVFKAIPFDDPSHSVAIKVIQRSGKLGYDDLMRFQKEASLMSQLHHPNIVVFHELGLFGRDEDDEGDDFGGGYYIVMEIADGTNLKESLARDGRKDLAYFFQVGLQVTAALDYTHGKNIIHRDIKPHNIIVGQAFRDQRGVLVKVLDFGVARLAEAIHLGGGNSAKDGSDKAADEAAGTPLYMAPEQTPLMDAPIDHRVDLYSLGCVLYELLAGKPPFTASSREKLEKQHVFADPEPLTNLRPDVPPLVEKIVHKLLAKHPNDRYQTAFSLHADLMRAKTLFEKAGGRPQGISFPLGLKDRFQAVSAQLQLIGREKDLQQLTTDYEDVAKPRGRARITLVKGGAGIGKSRLIAEFQSYLSRRNVRFVSGQFSQHENSLPFNALANAFNEYLHRVIKSRPHEAEELRRRFRATIGPAAHRIAEVVPGLKPFLIGIPEEDAEGVTDGQTSPGEVMTNAEAFATFAKAFSDFTRCLGTDNQPIVFLFQDLNWADEKSLDLIDTFFSNANTLQFFLVVTQRTGLHLTNERFNHFIEKFKKLKRRYQEIELTRISTDAIQAVVGNMLSSQESVTPELVAYLDEQSKGNPMHLVELTRTLVARDLIYPKTTGGEWEFDLKSVRKTQIQLNTIDLILSRIQDYGEFDRQVLGIAATIGLTFQFEMLLLGGRSQSVPVMKAVQRAMDEGLVIRVTDDPDLRHLGKTFMFAHKKARDAIYDGMDVAVRRALHKAIGEKFEASIPAPSEKILFALAHHFNSALVDGITDDQALAERALKYNTEGGASAYKSGSWQTAERYYENAWRIMAAWRDKICTVEQRANVQETLADLAAQQKRHGKALKAYRELLGQKLPPVIQAAIAYKAIHFQMVGGVMSETAKLIAYALKLLRRVVPLVTHAEKLGLALSLVIDALPFNKRKKRLYRVLHAAHVRREDTDKADREHTAIRIYESGSLLNLRDRRLAALIYHNYALAEALKGRGSAASLIRIVAERAALLGYLGQTRTAYFYLELAMDVARARQLRSTYGYIALLRVLTIDYVKGREEEVSDHLKEAMEFLKPNEDRLAYGEGLLFKIFRELTRCNFTALYRYSQRMPDTVPTRNWLSPRYVAIMLYGYLLQGSRDNIVRHGEMFLKRRQKVAGRGNDLFTKVIHTLIAFARGEIDKTREAYVITMQGFVGDSEFLYPFEEDFIGMVAFTFPIIFEQEHGRHLMRVQEMEMLLLKLKKRILSLKGNTRAIPMLLAARASELEGNPRNVRAQYDQALKSAKISGNNLVQVFAYLWFGTHLLESGQKKADYIRRAFLLAHKLELKTIVEYTKKLMEKKGIVLKEAAIAATATAKERDVRVEALPSRLFVEHLSHICEAAEAESTLTDDLAAAFAIMTKHYNTGRIHCIIVGPDGVPRVIFPLESVAQAQPIVDYVEPYVNIRSTLFLPMSDAPWSRDLLADGSDGLARVGAGVNDDEVQRGDEDPGEPFDANSTLLMEGAAPNIQQTTRSDDVAATAGINSVGSSGSSGTVKAGGTHRSKHIGGNGKGGQGLAMSALVPLRSNFNSLGVVFIEDVSLKSGRDTAHARGELDQFGAQLGILIERKSGLDLSGSSADTANQHAATAHAIYQPASYTLEPADWLRTWHYGRLRAQRETSWFLGLNFGANQYLLVYCMMNGQDQIKDRLSSMIWHQFYVIRSLAVASGRQTMEIGDLRDEFRAFLSCMPRAAQLDQLALAFTLINKDDKVCFSGHFGSARPFVVGMENVVTPSNDVVFTFSSGRDLRYFDVAAELNGPHTLIQSYDTSKLDAAPIDTVQRRIARDLAGAESTDDLHRILATMVSSENLPRYYVAAMLIDEVAAIEPPLDELVLPPLPKAE